MRPLFARRDWAYVNVRFAGRALPIKPALPRFLLSNGSRLLFECMSRNLKIGSDLDAPIGLLSQLVSIDFGGNHDVPDRHILDAARHTDEQCYGGTEAPDGALRNDGCRSVSRAHFGDDDVPAFNNTSMEHGSRDVFRFPVRHMAQHGARLHLQCRENERAVRW